MLTCYLRSCNEMRAKLEKATSKQERQRIEKDLRTHYKLVAAERQECEDRKFKAINEPTRYLYIEMDSMDQDKTAIPRLAREPKAMEDTGRVNVHVTAAKVPSLGKVFEFLYFNNLAHDANTTVTCLEQILQEVKNCQGFLPPVLYLQLDNTTRENKNKTMFAYLSLLVKLGVFRRIYLGFLPVGHTHGCVDQVFSCHSRELRRRDIITGVHLEAVLLQSYTPTPTIVILPEAADVKSWLAPFCSSTFVGITEGYQFLFEVIGEDVYIRDKLFSVASEYQPGAVLLTGIPNNEEGPRRAARRHLFFSHPKSVVSAGLTAEEKSIKMAAERASAEVKAQSCMNNLKKNIAVLRELKLLDDDLEEEPNFHWWEGIIETQENTDWEGEGKTKY